MKCQPMLPGKHEINLLFSITHFRRTKYQLDINRIMTLHNRRSHIVDIFLGDFE